jgi:hypothetical protein
MLPEDGNTVIYGPEGFSSIAKMADTESGEMEGRIRRRST